MRKEAAVVALGCAISGAIVLWWLSRTPEPIQSPPENAPPPPPHAWWVEIDELQPYRGDLPAYTRWLLWLAAQRNDDGSYGNGPAQLHDRPLGRTGLTALSLLPFFGAGYAPYSKELYVYEGGDWSFGKETRKSLQWLLRDQRVDGTFRSVADGPFDQALAAFALSDIYGITESPAWKQPAQRAVDALLKMQEPDGTWDGAGPTAWAIIALYCARVSELTVDPSAFDRVPFSPGFPQHPGEALARVLQKRDPKDAVFQILDESRGRDATDVAWWYLATLSMWAYGGIRGKEWWDYKPGAEWGTWNDVVRERLLPAFRNDGSLEGKSPEDAIVRSCLAQLTLEVYYRYTCVFRPH